MEVAPTVPVGLNLASALVGQRRPYPPDNAGAFHLGEDLQVALLADDAAAVAVGEPAAVFAGGLVIFTASVVARPLVAFLLRRRQRRQTLPVGEPADGGH